MDLQLQDHYFRSCNWQFTLTISLIALTVVGCVRHSDELGQQRPVSENWFFWSVDWESSGDRLILGGSNDTYFKVLSSSQSTELKTYRSLGTITQTKWHPRENKVAIAVQDGKGYPFIFDIDKEWKIQLDSTSIDGARAIGWNTSGKLLAIGDYEGDLIFYNEFGTFIKRIHTGQPAIIGLDWHPTENIVVAVGEKISIYDYDSDTLHQTNDRNEAVEVLMLCVDWHPSGKFFVTGDYGDFEHQYPPMLQYWTYEGIRMRSITESEAEIRNIEWSSDGNLLATASEKIRLWDTAGNLVAESPTESLLWGIDWNKRNDTIVTTDEDRNVSFWSSNLELLSQLKL